MTFDTQRFITLIKHNLLENKATYIRLYIGAFVAFSMLILLALLSSNFGYETIANKAVFYQDYLEKTCRDVFIPCVLIGALMASVAASHIFSNMNTKQSRLSFLMLPATNIEKFASRYVLYVILAPIGLALTYLAADFSCTFFTLLRTKTFTSPILVSHQRGLISDTLTTLFDVQHPLIFLLLCAPSTLILGGTIFRRVPFILTHIALYGLSMVGTIGMLIFLLIVNGVFDLDNIPDAFLSAVFLYILPISWCVFCHCMSYRIFCRSNVIGHKLIGM